MQGIRAPRLPHAEVAAGPAQAAKHGEEDREHVGDLGSIPPDHHQSGDRHPHPGQGSRGAPFAEEQCGQEHGEGRRRLQHDRSESRRHASAHRQIEEGELGGADPQTSADDPLPGGLRARHQHDGWKREQQVAQRAQEERRKGIECQAGRREIDPPDHDHHQGEKSIAGAHATTVVPTTLQHNFKD